MKFGVFSIRDFKTGFLAPTCEVNESVAVRNFEHAVLQSEQTLFFSHPEDYALFRIGHYDSDTGDLIPCAHIELITASQVFNSAMAKRFKEVVPDGDEGRNT